MTLLPIVERELRVRARQGLTFWTRGLFGGVAILFCLQQLSYADVFRGTFSAGEIAFRGLAVMAAVICAFGFLATADSISQERREHTLGLLLLTGINSGDVLLGKLLSAGLIQVTALLAFVPVLMLPVLAGGVMAGEALLTAAALGHILFCSLVFGLWASSCRNEWFAAVRLALFCLLAWWFGPWILDGVMGGSPTVGLLSPLSALSCAMKNSPGYVALSIGLGQVIGWGLLVRARSRLRRGATEETAPAQESKTPGELAERGSLLVSAPEQRALTAPNYKNDPLAWLMRRQRGVLAAIWVATLLVIVSQYSSVWFYFFGRPLAVTWVVLQPAIYAMNAVTGALIVWAASRFFFEARRSGEMEMLLTTPVGAARMVVAHWAYLKRLLRWPVVLMVILALPQQFIWGWSAVTEWGWWFPVGLATLGSGHIILSAVGLCWAGMYFGTRFRSQWVVIIAALALMKLVPFLISSTWWAVAPLLVPVLGGPGTILLLFSFVPYLLIMTYWLVLIFRFRRKLLAGNLARLEEESISWLPKILRGKTWRQIRHWSAVDSHQNR
jgi:ABC-type transport system involved in multi-copper enzyme maturation permease subunit